MAPASAGQAGTSAAATPVRLTPEQAVINAAESEAGVTGVFEMVIRATGRAQGNLHLNTQLDYRDPRNLSIVIPAEIEEALAARLGQPVEQAVLNSAIAVRGTARKTRIDFLDPSSRPTGRYYFQTHLRLQAARHLTVAGETPFS